MRRDRPDLVLTDVMMPGIGGFALLRALRADPRTRAIPIVLLSARAGEDARIEGVESGADDYVVKPFSSRELVARINAQMALALAARDKADLLAREQVARREAELQKQHLHALFMEAPVAIAVLRGPSYVVELANASICEIWRRRHDQVIGRPLFDTLQELRDQPWKPLLDAVCATGRPYAGSEAPVQFRTGADGERATSYLNFVYTPLRTQAGTVDGVMVMATDVTDQVLAREEMRRLRETAEAASRAKDEFLAMLGHELRNPLAPIRTALELLRLRGVDAALRERQIIERQVAHLVALVDDLLDVSRITRGKVELRRSLVEASAIVARGIEMASPLLEQHHHELIVDVPREGLPLYGDPARLAQVIANLLTNAAKYTEPGGRIHVLAPRDRRRRRAVGARQRRRHRRGDAPDDLRPVRAGAAVAGPIARRARPRADDRAQRCRTARRPCSCGRATGEGRAPSSWSRCRGPRSTPSRSPAPRCRPWARRRPRARASSSWTTTSMPRS